MYNLHLLLTWETLNADIANGSQTDWFKKMEEGNAERGDDHEEAELGRLRLLGPLSRSQTVSKVQGTSNLHGGLSVR